MIITYPAIFHKEGSDYWVEFPDLQGCQSFGGTLNETIVGAQEALTGYVLTLWEEGLNLPKASNMQEIHTDKSSFASLITADIKNFRKNTKSVKKTLTLPSWLNDLAVEKGINFSGLLQEALVRELKLVNK